MNNKPEIKPIGISPLKHICMTIGELPTSYLETMTYYEMLVWFTKFLKERMIPALDNNALAVEELQNLFIELQTYVNDYFDNLDVQDEINNKLDQMLEDGVLEQIIEQFLQSTAIWCFNNLQEMKEATNLTNGSFAKTLGYYSANDGGEALYKIRRVTNDDVVDEQYIIEVYDDLLVAELIIKYPIDVRCLGIKGDGTLNSDLLMNALTKENSFIFKDGEYNFNTVTLTNLDSYNLYGDNATIKTNGSFSFNSCSNISIKELNFTENVNNCLRFTNCQNVIVESCDFTNSTTATIRMIRTSGNVCKNFKFINNNFLGVSKTNTWGGALYVDGQGKTNSSDTTETLPIEQIEVRGNTFEEVGTGGVNFGGVKDVIVDSNIFKNSYGSQNMLSTYSRESTNLVISNNTFSGCGWECCILNYCNKATISGNYFEDYGYAVTIENESNNIIISNNVFDGMKDNRSHTGSGMQSNTYGTGLFNCKNIEINSNTFRNNVPGIIYNSKITNTSILNNLFLDNDNAIQYDGNLGHSEIGDLNISNNTIKNCSVGIDVSTLREAIINNNLINTNYYCIKAYHFADTSKLHITNNSLISGSNAIDVSSNYNIDCSIEITNNRINATTSPLKKYSFDVNCGLIKWFNPDVTINKNIVGSKFVKGSIVKYDGTNFNSVPDGASAGAGYYMNKVENGVVFIMSDGVWKRKTGGGGATNVTTADM